jgi:hypothetical protein
MTETLLRRPLYSEICGGLQATQLGRFYQKCVLSIAAGLISTAKAEVDG